MITLITGLPGNGKTLYAVSWLKAKAEKENRPVYYSGITDCRVPGWIELSQAEEWPSLPSGSIILIDEVQRVMRPRQHGATVPAHVSKLETHRHLGVDLVLITQHPMLLDSNVRRLVGQHFHVVRKFGMHRATVHEWNAAKENCDKNREDSIRHEWKYPAEAFGLYKSAELHTHKRRVPMRVWLLLALPFFLIGLAWYTWNRLDPSKKGEEPQLAQSVRASESASPAGPGGTPRAAGAAAGVLSTADYVAQQQPRIAGLAYTAPAYDTVTRPTEAPYPAACLSSATRCKCYSQQGTVLETTGELCRAIAAGGFFVAWRPAQLQAVAPGASAAVGGGSR